ncbi:hypothetical protein CspeluHIS016_0211370 [Cutaneotrichosporon spelunceum]|uniref:Major facilitator superfamily (MFS) profile domain-containing protein n=1 Tax=Cutaneotrichosporon spelunceum TaxID=1672016 RepID=A0AAD3TSE2_9TREE|nr:hypothetical protein CspeluHIS016_0211370 [Cutaneotrichosporon spelunceum]
MTADFKDDKVHSHHKEHFEIVTKDVNNDASSESIDLEALDVDEKRLIRKIDYHLVPWLAFLYLLSFLDRSNIGNANIFGLSKHLNLNEDKFEYGLALAIFFVFYVLFEVPSNMVMKAWRPSMWIPTIMVAWGLVMIGMGFVSNFTSLFVTRLLLGMTEAGLFPGVSFYLTQWYRKYEISWRISLFFSAATAAGAFGGLLARLINLMDGVAGLHGWQWIFILEGILTVIAAIASFFIMYDYPGTAKFLSEPERAVVINRLYLDNDGCSHNFKMKFVWDAFTDWKVWCTAIMFHGSLCPVYTFSLFAPTLTKNLGYTAAKAQLMSVPPYVVAAVVTLSAGWISDRIKKRGIIVIVCSAIGALGYGLLLAHVNHAVDYFALFLAASGMYPLIPVIVAWGANNCGGSLKKGVATAIIVSIGNCGGIVSSFIYPSRDAPRFKTGHTVCLIYCLICILTAVIMWIYCVQANKKRAARNAERTHEWTAEEKLHLEDRGDHNDWFVYTL